MIKLLNIEKTANDEGGELISNLSPIAVNMAFVGTAEPLGDGRTKLVMSWGEQLIVIAAFTQIHESLKVELNK